MLRLKIKVEESAIHISMVSLLEGISFDFALLLFNGNDITEKGE